MQLGFYFDQTRCTGCYTCIIACKDWNDVAAGPASWRRVRTIERGEYPDLFVAFLSTACYHCAEPVCISVCPAKAITKREDDGIVVVDRDKCKEETRCGIISDESTRVPFEERDAPCTLACPAHISVPGYVALIANGRYKEALNLIRDKVPIPRVLAHVCNAPCEKVCARKDVDEAIAICALKRFVADSVTDKKTTPIQRTRKERVAIVGSGPAGLTAAYDLLRMGYGVTIFEASPVAGGMLALGIPEYRLPRDVLNREIEEIKSAGVDIRLNTPVNGIESVLRDGYQAMFIAVGAHKGDRSAIPGVDSEDVYDAIEFLKKVNLGEEISVGKRVAVIGGGDSAIDSARAALRKGAEEVHILYRRERSDMPATAEEIDAAAQEGISFHFLAAPTRVLAYNGTVTGVECARMELREPDRSGRRTPYPIKGSEHVVNVDTVIWAIGQKPDLSFLRTADGIKVSEQGTIVVDPETLETNRGGIFAGGDAIGDRASVIDAVAYGKKAAFYIDRYLKGEIVKGGRWIKEVQPSDIKVTIPPDIEKAERQRMPELTIDKRWGNFRQVALGFSEEQAITEAKRCLNCAGQLCREVCPYKAPQFGAEAKAKMQMCNLCLERWAEGQKPVCVTGCPLRALDAGPLDELAAKYGEMKEAHGFVYSSENKPSIIFKPRPNFFI